MSRYYEMSVEVTDYDPEKEDGIKAVAAEEWNFEVMDPFCRSSWHG